jgi:Lrp/AsnC family leucine-responsive transcriptional regulator
MSLDETDIRILEYLQQDGRASLRKLAEEIGISPSPASNRFHSLQERGINMGFRPIIVYVAVRSNPAAS